ncbi:MAG: PilZ domain-containing protein [Acidobacteriota bacterium]|nr:PilZ domain-containing protein [Acidobacteriota bacterium]MDQ3421189.1 PilZ domain-containing protein [Acidobacteriota bacterium]
MPRYRLDATIAVADGTGRTIDLSSNSVYFESLQSFKPGDEVPLVFPLATGGNGAQVQCTARVVRVDPRGDVFGVAATYEPVVFTMSGAL